MTEGCERRDSGFEMRVLGYVIPNRNSAAGAPDSHLTSLIQRPVSHIPNLASRVLART